jgi:hypothetical protein
MIAGLYLGEVFRLVMMEMVDEGILFLGQNTYKLEKPFCFDTAFVSLIEADLTDDLLTVIGLFSHFFAIETTIEERKFFVRLAQLIGTRAARLSACGIAAIVSKMGYLNEGGCGVATDGSLYNVSRLPESDVRMATDRRLSLRFCRNIPNSPNASTKPWSISLERRAGRSRLTTPRMEVVWALQLSQPCPRSDRTRVSTAMSRRAIDGKPASQPKPWQVKARKKEKE